MEFKSNFDKVLKRIEKASDEASGDYQLSELLTADFLTKYTSYTNIDDFFNASPIDVSIINDEIKEKFEQEDFSEFVAANSKFTSWDDMLAEAGKIAFSKNFKL